jgi:ribosomal protein S27E
MNVLTLDTRLEDFKSRHSAFLEVLCDACRLIDDVFNQPQLSSISRDVDVVVLLLAQEVRCNFEEIAHLCAGGFGLGAQKVLRSMFEATVVCEYISRTPDEAKRFLEYSHIQNHKLKAEWAKVRPPRTDEEKAAFEESKRRREEAEKQFQQTDCKKCGTQRLMHSWTKLGIVDLARNSPRGLASHYAFCYVIGTLQTHPTLSGIASRFLLGPVGELLDGTPREEETVDLVLYYNHLLLMLMLDVVNDHFNLGMKSQLEDRNEDLLAGHPNVRNRSSETTDAR